AAAASSAAAPRRMLSCSYVSQYSRSSQFRSADDSGGDEGGSAAIRAQGERAQQTFTSGRGQVRAGGRRGGGSNRAAVECAHFAQPGADPRTGAGAGQIALDQTRGTPDRSLEIRCRIRWLS